MDFVTRIRHLFTTTAPHPQKKALRRRTCKVADTFYALPPPPQTKGGFYIFFYNFYFFNSCAHARARKSANNNPQSHQQPNKTTGAFVISAGERALQRRRHCLQGCGTHSLSPPVSSVSFSSIYLFLFRRLFSSGANKKRQQQQNKEKRDEVSPTANEFDKRACHSQAARHILAADFTFQNKHANR